MTQLGYGLDLSHFQNPETLPWEQFRGKVDLVIARASYGSEMHDDREVAHIKHARAIGAKVGIYIFFRSIQTVAAQFDTLRVMADACGLGAGDLVPAIDVEHDPFPGPGRDVVSSWSGPCEELAGKITEEYGNAIVYVTQREWHMLGSPEWVLHRPLWAAHYINSLKPATPGNMPATIWQHRVGAFDPNGPGGYFKRDTPPILDQNRILLTLPLIGSRITNEDRVRVAEQVALSLATIAAERDTDPVPPS